MMFGEVKPPKPKTRSRPRPLVTDIQLPSVQPNHWAHMGRPPDTDYPWKMMLYKQRKQADYVAGLETMKAAASKELFDMKFLIHGDKRRYHGEIQRRLALKVHEYDKKIDERRTKLMNIFAHEEREFIRETVDVAQRGDETRMMEIKEKVQALKAMREAERKKMVEDKRMQQYGERSIDLKEQLAKQHLVESKRCQLEQMKEHEAMKEAEREIGSLYHELLLKEVDAKMEREEQTQLAAHYRNMEQVSLLNQQVKGKELLKAERHRIAEEDRIEMDRFRDKLRRQEIDVIQQKKKKDEEADRQLRHQIAERERLMEERKREAKATQDAYNQLAQKQLDDEIAKVSNTTAVNKKELALYRQHLAQLKREQEIEQKRLDGILKQYQEGIQKKQDDDRCKVEMAKKKLHEDVLRTRAQQLEQKKKLAEDQMKKQQDEDEMFRTCYETNQCLAREHARKEAEARMQYSDDLMQQVEYRNLLQQREREEVERQVAAGQQEEVKYRNKINDILSGNVFDGQKHPFKGVFDRSDCRCASPPKHH